MFAVAFFVAGCGQGGAIVASDGGADSAARVVEAGGEASVVDNYLGSWMVAGTQMLDCAGQEQTVENSGTLEISAGTASDLTVSADCSYPFNVENGVAQLVSGQACASTIGTFTATYQTWTILTTDGQTGGLVAAGTETGTTQSGVAYSCIFTEQATLTR
jgi:hypothetical protein